MRPRVGGWKTILSFCLLLLAGLSAGERVGAAPADWPGWRGPQGSGHSQDESLPTRWGPESVLWKAALPGSGQSSPITWGDRIFLTAALDQGRQRVVLCLRRSDGAQLWERVAWSGEPEPTHQMNGWASATCATDGHYVVAFFGRGGGLHCYTVEGEHVWSRELGEFESPWGTAASPLMVQNLVVQNCDSDRGAYIIALDKGSGQQVWRSERPDHRGWSSPILIDTGERQEIVLNGHTGVTAYDPATGRQLWHCAAPRGRGSPTVTPDSGLLYVLNGLGGGGLYCVRPGGEGDVTSSRRLWMAPRGGRDLPSPIVVGDTVLVMGLRGGILTGYDARSGDELWVQRIGGQFSASPVAYNGRAFFLDEAGKTYVIDPDSESKVEAINELKAADDEIFRAAITPCRGQLLIRSDQALYCVGE